MRHLFANPWALYLLAAVPALAVAGLLAARRRRRAVAGLGSAAALRSLAAREGFGPALRSVLLGAALTWLAVGVAGPQWGLDPEGAVAQGRDLVVVLDLSRSMLAETPSRLARAKA